jgi:FdhD protein
VDLVVLARRAREITEAAVIEEQSLSIYVNGTEVATVMCTPIHQEALALGFLLNEGMIGSVDDVGAAHLCTEGTCVDIWLNISGFEPPRRFILTSGCAGGITFDDLTRLLPPLPYSDLRIAPEKLQALMDALYQEATLHSLAGGVHASALSDSETLLLTAEDIGRHNTLDKLHGMAAQRGIDTRGRLLLTTGRISSEMLNKARRMEVPLIASRTSPTSLSVGLARLWNITLIGYLRRDRLSVYAHPERLMPARH